MSSSLHSDYFIIGDIPCSRSRKGDARMLNQFDFTRSKVAFRTDDELHRRSVELKKGIHLTEHGEERAFHPQQDFAIQHALFCEELNIIQEEMEKRQMESPGIRPDFQKGT